MKDKIWNFEYIDLSLLLKQNFVNNINENQNTLEIVDGKLVIHSKTKKVKSIDNINTWTDAFVTYLQVVIDNHPSKCKEMLKYMSVIRAIAEETLNDRWLHYDQQFRLRVARNPAKSWANIDAELWLRFVANGTVPQSTTSVRLSKYPCYEYNSKGQCVKQKCIYRHICMKCYMQHPAINCIYFQGYGTTTPTFQLPQIRPNLGNPRMGYNIHRPLNPVTARNSYMNIRPRNVIPRR